MATTIWRAEAATTGFMGRPATINSTARPATTISMGSQATTDSAAGLATIRELRAKDALRHIWETGANQGWSANGGSLAGVLTSEPAAALNTNNWLEVFARGANNEISHIWQTSAGGPGWSQWHVLDVTPAGGFASSPRVVANMNDGRLEVFAIGADGAMWHNYQTTPSGPAWKGWISLGGSFQHDPSPAINLDGRIEVFAWGTDNAVWHRSQQTPGGGW